MLYKINKLYQSFQKMCSNKINYTCLFSSFDVLDTDSFNSLYFRYDSIIQKENTRVLSHSAEYTLYKMLSCCDIHMYSLS